MKMLLVAGGVLWVALMAALWSLNEAHAASDSEQYNFSWLDPEKKIYVLQNRRYVKAKRLMLSAMGGTSYSDPYRDAYALNARAAFYFSESLGVEGFYSKAFTSENNNYEALKQVSPATLPVVREVRSQIGANLQWVPWYAKINVFNQILYFDWYFSAGAGTLNVDLDTRTRSTDPAAYTPKSYFAFFLGTGQMFHISDRVAVRLDFSSALYRAPLFGTTGENTWYSNSTLGAGVGFKL
jgi:outer membrane beta-barrel protein